MLQHYKMNIAAIHVKTYWHVMPNASRFNLFSSTLDYIKDTQWLNCLPVMSHLLLIPLEYHSHAIMRKDKKCTKQQSQTDNNYASSAQLTTLNLS